MASATEMLMKQIVKSIGLDPEKVQQQVAEIRGLFVGGFQHAEQANRRLHRIETHLGLSDIEPIHNVLVITHESNSEQQPVPPVARGDGS